MLNKPHGEQRNDNHDWIKPALLIGMGVLIVGIMVYLMAKHKQSKR